MSTIDSKLIAPISFQAMVTSKRSTDYIDDCIQHGDLILTDYRLSFVVIANHRASISASSLIWTGLAMKSLIPA